MGAFTIDSNYNLMSQVYTLSQSIDTTLVTGNIYRFQYRAMNAIGYSDFSDITSVAMVDPPAQANAPTKIVS